MKISTKIITNNTTDMNKQLFCYFDHPFQIIDPSKQCQDNNVTLANKDITSYILQHHNNSLQRYQCLIVYKIELDVRLLKQNIEKDSQNKGNIYEYDPKSKLLELKLALPGENQYDIKCRDQKTLILDLSSQHNVTRTYFLPYSNGTQQAQQLTRAIHQNFKLTRVLNQYIRLQDNCEQIQFSEPILLDLREFLYANEIKYIQIIIWTEQNKFDMKLLQKIGQLKLPEPWLQKQSYRSKKYQIFQLKLEESKLLKVFKEQKKQFTNSINFLQELSGIPAQNYDNIDLQSLKAIKSQNLSSKIQQIIDNERILNNLQFKISDLTVKKTQYLSKMQKIQKHQVTQILGLKQQVLQLQTRNPNINAMKSGLIFLKSRKSAENKVLKTIFSSNDRKAQRMRDTFRSCFDVSDSDQYRTVEVIVPVIESKKQYKSNDKKVTNVVKEIGQFKMNKRALREKYENEIMKIDFEVQIRNNQLLNLFKNASAELGKILESNQNINI